MIALLKLVCLAIYALGLAAAFDLLPEGYAIMGPVAALLLAAHVLEIAVAFKFLRRYPGSLAASLGLTLLFGVLHWGPLRTQDASAKI